MSEVKGTKALELWCKRLVKNCPNIQIENMTTSWRNGMAFCALVHHFRPDLIDLSKLNPDDIYENNQLAYSIAEKHLGIPALLDPEDMVEHEVPDRLSVLTYLSQFYQRLGHTVQPKTSESETNISTSTPSTFTPIKFGKVGLDKCAACGLPVYLAQRLIVSQKLYHRRCFRCSKCSGHLNPKNFLVIEASDFTCDSCKNEKSVTKYLNNNDQMGMLAFNSDSILDVGSEESVTPKHKPRPQSILEKISIFEQNSARHSNKDNIDSKFVNLSLKDKFNNKYSDVHTVTDYEIVNKTQNQVSEVDSEPIRTTTVIDKDKIMLESESLYKDAPEKKYKSNVSQFNFLQTQLAENVMTSDDNLMSKSKPDESREEMSISSVTKEIIEDITDPNPYEFEKEENNITDDKRLAQNNCAIRNTDSDFQNEESNESIKNEPEISISVPPRRKKNQTLEGKNSLPKKVNVSKEDYPIHLNPFSEDEDEIEEKQEQKRISTNPFGSSDEDDDHVPPIKSLPQLKDIQASTPIKRHIIAKNPFWSDGEEPSTDEDSDGSCDQSTNMYKSPITTSTPNLPGSTPRRKKGKAPPPPVVVTEHFDIPCTSMDDIASLSSMSSHTSTIHSDQKSYGASTPRLKKKRPAPTPLDSISTLSGGERSLDKDADISGGGRRMKGPAPGLPLPERREVKLQMSPEELQVQLDLLETQQLGLERQGVLIEQMIRDKCEGDDATPVPQEEVEDLVIQLCELVNEKNDLFRKQTELMYIRRQQRLEQEQADIEHEIRIIQSRPAVNRIDADKVREEQLVSRLVEIVRLRDELVQQLDAERRRERQEDLAIAASIATKRAQRNSESNSSSMKSADAATPGKKNKVKDKVKKQLKKAKHTLINKKKDEEKVEKEKKPK